ncbi:MAG: helix-turn-helix transcriptional regulator [Ruminococcaceae bacterium]|nr:helix-turn-helix transcriptional regulator [Oscillospiraceae bacterium]
MSIDFGLIGARIKETRKEAGKTQEWLAEQIDVSVGYISQIERGITKISLDTLSEICAVLNGEMSYLVAGTATKQNNYLKDEIAEKFSRLSERDKKIIIDLIESMIKN